MAKKKAAKPEDDIQNLGLFKEVMSVIFGIQPVQMDRIMDIINNSEDKLNVKTYIVRDKSGPRAVKYLRLAVEYARHEGSQKHEEDDTDFEMTKDYDLEATAKGERPKHEPQPQDDAIDMEPKSIKECTFRDFLMEVEISDDPIQGRIDAMKAARNPDAYRKEKMKDNIEAKRDVMKNKDDPHAAEKARILQRKIQTQKDEQRLAKKAAAEAGVQGQARPMTGMSS
jgi:hypothetical protein